MAYKAVCEQCNVVISCKENVVHFFDMFCPTCRSKLSRYDNTDSWKLPHVVYSPSEIIEASEKGLQKASNVTTGKGVLDH